MTLILTDLSTIYMSTQHPVWVFEFQTVPTHHFRPKTPHSNQFLSDLEHIEIWHDGEGWAPDWDLKRIILTDQLTGKKYEFMFIEKNKFTTIKKGTIYSSVANGKSKLSLLSPL